MKLEFECNKGIQIVHISGKLDSFNSQEIADKLNSQIDKGFFNLILDLGKVDYLSSMGIRVLLTLKKRVHRLNGDVKLSCVQPYPLNILKISGFLDIFSIYDTINDAEKSFITAEQIEMEDPENIETCNTSIGVFKFLKRNNNPSKIKITGSNIDFLYARCSEESIVSENLSNMKYSLGIGGLGEKIADYFNCIGELMTIAGTVVWVPTDGHNIPDFLIPMNENEEIKIHTVFNIALDNTFNEIVRFEADNQRDGATIDAIYEELFSISGKRIPDFKGLLGLVMRADVGAIFGAGIKRAPIQNNTPENKQMITHRENIKEWLNFQVELEHKNTTALIVGVGLDYPSKFDPSQIQAIFNTDPATKKSKLFHNHAAIFKFLPEIKTSYQLENEINNVFKNGDFISMQHLLDRSTFKKGIIGLNYVQEII